MKITEQQQQQQQHAVMGYLRRLGPAAMASYSPPLWIGTFVMAVFFADISVTGTLQPFYRRSPARGRQVGGRGDHGAVRLRHRRHAPHRAARRRHRASPHPPPRLYGQCRAAQPCRADALHSRTARGALPARPGLHLRPRALVGRQPRAARPAGEVDVRHRVRCTARGVARRLRRRCNAWARPSLCHAAGLGGSRHGRARAPPRARGPPARQRVAAAARASAACVAVRGRGGARGACGARGGSARGGGGGGGGSGDGKADEGPLRAAACAAHALLLGGGAGPARAGLLPRWCGVCTHP